jgi:hypothetical protein
MNSWRERRRMRNRSTNRKCHGNRRLPWPDRCRDRGRTGRTSRWCSPVSAGYLHREKSALTHALPTRQLRTRRSASACGVSAGVAAGGDDGMPRLQPLSCRRGMPRTHELRKHLSNSTHPNTRTSSAGETVRSFSRFAIASSALAGVGFHIPLEPVAGALNTAKGGTTVPLKFNVYDDGGVEITNPADIANPNFLVAFRL